MMAHSKPLITPEAFSGAASESWDEWIDHFESVADINKWETNAEKLKWLKVRLTGRAMKAFRQLPEAARRDYKEAKKALRKRFEPESRKSLYVAELQMRRRRKGEDWATFGEELKLIAEKAYPDLEANAREQIALNQYLTSITNPQVAFSVRQQRPTTVDRAVTITLEMESYLGPTMNTVAQVGATIGCDVDETVGSKVAVVAKDATLELLQRLTDRLDRLESKLCGGAESNKSRRPRSSTVTCWNCHEEGHFARDCERNRQLSARAVNTVAQVEAEHTPVITAVQAIGALNSDCHVHGSVNGVETTFLVDTGADVSILSFEVWKKMKDKPQLRKSSVLMGVQQTPLQVCGEAEVEIKLAERNFSTQMVVVTAPLTTRAILGKDFLREKGCIIDFGRDALHFKDNDVAVPFGGSHLATARICTVVDSGAGNTITEHDRIKDGQVQRSRQKARHKRRVTMKNQRVINPRARKIIRAEKPAEELIVLGQTGNDKRENNNQKRNNMQWTQGTRQARRRSTGDLGLT